MFELQLKKYREQYLELSKRWAEIKILGDEKRELSKRIRSIAQKINIEMDEIDKLDKIIKETIK